MKVPFLGREGELAELAEVLRAARAGRPQIVLLEGPAGVGKTALLGHFLAGVDVPRVLYASGEEGESELAFSVLAQLLPDRAGAWADALSAGAELLEVLDDVVLVVDDDQWADPPSLQALTFALRRLRVDRVVAVVVVRDAADPRIPEGLRRLCTAGGSVRLPLAGLPAAELRALGREIGVGELSARAAARLHAHTDGNPLHAAALLQQAGPALLKGLEEEPDVVLPAPQSFTSLVLGRLADCGEEAAALVAAASVLGSHCALDRAAALARLTDPLPALEEAVAAGLLTDRAGDPVVRFPHPLVHAAVYQQLGPVRRNALHLRAAQLTDDEALRLRHRARAATGHDAALAADLARLGRRLAADGAWAGAAGQLAAAARLSADRAGYEQLTLEAVECGLLAGEIPDAAGAALRIAGFAESCWRSYLLGRLSLFDLDRAEALLRDAWQRCDPEADPVLGARIAGQFAAFYGSMARGTDMAEWAGLALRLAPDDTATDMIRYLELSGRAMSGHAAETLAALGPLPDPAVAPPAQLEQLMGRGTLREFTGDLTGAVRDLTGVLAACHSRAASFRVVAATALASAEYRAGHWDDAIVHSELALSLAADSDQPHIALYCRMLAALTYSARGAFAKAQAHARVVREYAAWGHVNPVVWAALSEAYLARARGRPEEVALALDPLLALGRRGMWEEPGAMPWPDLLADAWTACGELERAEDALVAYEQLAAERHHHGALALAARSRGTLEAARGDAAAAERAFKKALHHADRGQALFERALLHLAYGQFLRRAGKRARAGEQLRAARAILLRLDAQPDLVRCARELAACGLEVGEHRPRKLPPGTALAEETEAAVSALPELGKLEFRIHRVKCLDSTSEIGKDEIYLGGTCVDESGDTKKISQFKVRSFDTGNEQVYSPPRQFTFFNLREGTNYPKSYFVTLVLAEVDWGGFANFLNDLLDKVKAKVIAALTAAIGISGGAIGIIIGTAVGYVVGQVFEYLKKLWGDEIFKPVTLSTIVPSLTSRWAGKQDSPERTVTYSGYGGKYQVVYDWRMFA
ncbi:ATP-binding protein [Streptomyces sp. 21So2-11]|uniref:ATP-binding protein n=1 Tax=Streptomyces sp. 21So2-11 TaxID=3144408 RepID=UPI00321AA1C1